ncbi:MAG: GGDEF domain-containing protein [Betaproteobacteria bacterium]|nr:GGDEF domain-containing protein [Betaproteobacteria bacterium]
MTGQLRLDAATLVFATSLLAFSLAILCALLARGAAAKRLGLHEWSASLAFASFAFLLFFFRGTAPWVLTYLVANTVMLAVVPFTMLAYSKLLKVEAPVSSVALSSAVGLSGVLAVYFLGTDAQFGVFSMSMAIGFQLVLAALMVAMAPRRHGAQWRVVLNIIHGLSALAFFVRAGMALNGKAVLVSTVANSPAQIMALCVAALYFTVATVVFIVMVSQRQHHEMSDRLRRDGLTGLYTRTAFFEMAVTKPCQWQAGGYALVLMDIDNFKRINDSYGHAGGDAVLAHAARMLSQLTRLSDIAVRYGGEEFCVLLHACSAEEAGRFAQRLVDEAGRQSVRIKDGRNVSFTFSVGYACAPAGQSRDGMATLEAVIDRADQALYAAKTAGRNRAESGCAEAGCAGASGAGARAIC